MMRATSLVILLAFVGCIPPRGSSVVLEAPPATAPFEQRQAAFEKLKALGVGGQKKTFWKTGEVRYLELADNRLVYDPEDLLTVVRPDSATAQAIGEYRKASDMRRLKRNLAAVALGASVALLGAGIAIKATQDTSDRSSTGFFMIGFGTFGLIGSGLGLWAVTSGNHIRFSNQKSVERAFKHYDEALAARLRVCVRGTALVDCDAR
jgi:hypothetical protein